MNYEARWLANNHIIFSFLYDFNRQVETRWLRSNRCMHDLIPIFNHIITLYLGIINHNHPVQNTLLIILRRIRFELLDQSSQQLLANPPSLRESAINVRVRLYEPKRIEAAIDRSDLFFSWLHYKSIHMHFV